MKTLIEEFNERKENLRELVISNLGESFMEKLIQSAEAGDAPELYTNLNNLWYILPDHVFNIQVNPKGYNDLLYLCENYL